MAVDVSILKLSGGIGLRPRFVVVQQVAAQWIQVRLTVTAGSRRGRKVYNLVQERDEDKGYTERESTDRTEKEKRIQAKPRAK